jgi:glycosyltransferase involved in cell wall biosynthesis
VALVLHLLPVDLARGAQTYARELRMRLDGPEVRHRTATLFRSDGATLAPDYRLDVPDGKLRRYGFDPRAAWHVRRLMRELAPSVVVAHGSEPLKYAVLAGVPRSKLVYYRIGIGSVHLAGIRRLPYRFLFRRAGVIATVSHDVADDVFTYGVEARRVCVIPNARAARASPPRHVRGAAVTTRLAFVGRMIDSKRPLLFVDVVRALGASGCTVEGIMAGGGPLLARVCDASRDLPIHVVGEVDDVNGLLAASDVFVFTSVAAGEGMPGVLIEASLASLPIVTTGVPGARDVVEDNETGFVVGVDDAEELIAAARRLAEDPVLRRAMGERARVRAEELFGFERNAEQWRALVTDVIEGSCEFST